MSPPSDIHSWLESNGLGELVPLFEENHITLAMLPNLTGDDIRDMGITSLGQRKKLLAAIAAFNTPAMRQVSSQLPVSEPIVQPALAPLVQAAAPEIFGMAPAPSRRKSKRKAFSAAFLTASICLHLMVAVGAGYWVVQKIEAKRKLQFTAGAPTANPSKRAMEHKVSLRKKKNAGGSPAQARRIAVTGLAAKITLPEMPSIPTTSTQFVAGRMAGMGGAGFGSGLGFGNGSGMGVGGAGAGGLGLTMFGARSGVGLTGYFYDLKQTKDGKPTDLAPMVADVHSLGPQYLDILRKFGENWDTRLLDKYYRSQKPLIATQLYVTLGPSNEAAKAFGEEKKCVGSGWIVHYKGSAIAPKDGTFRFIGLGDNVLLVRVNGKNNFDYGSTVSATENSSADLGPAGPGWRLGGGAWFEVRRGEVLRLEVLIGDFGGFFSDYLFIEEKGAKYAERSDAPGFPAYPVFQLKSTKIPKDAGINGNPVPASKQLVFPAASSTNTLDMPRR